MGEVMILTNLKAIREIRGLTIDDLAKQANLNTSYVQQFEEGRAAGPDDLSRICSVLDVTPDALTVPAPMAVTPDPEVVKKTEHGHGKSTQRTHHDPAIATEVQRGEGVVPPGARGGKVKGKA
jgi:transcriptional regulator with XRE-family HTH domain